jgi:hypothetical protein
MGEAAFYWGDGITTFEGKTYSAGTLFSDGNFNTYQLNQESGYLNTVQGYSIPGNGDWVNWTSSYYNYDYIY